MNKNNTYISSFLPIMASNNKTPSTIVINFPYIIPDQETTVSTKITGILENDITYSLRNKFGPILPDSADLQALFALADATQMPSWIGTSAQVWQGTDPISLSFDMYILNWSPECDTEDKLSKLAQLCSVSPQKNTADGEASAWRVRVHGNYQASVLSNNKDWFDKSVRQFQTVGKDGNKTNLTSSDKLDEQVATGTGFTEKGTLTIQVGSQAKLSKLILTRCDITPSVVEVYSPSAGVSPRPLYYRVGLSMQTCRTALSTDIPGLFGLS